MVGHIYGRISLLTNPDRPHMFLRELALYIDYLRDLAREDTASGSLRTLPITSRSSARTCSTASSIIAGWPGGSSRNAGPVPRRAGEVCARRSTPLGLAGALLIYSSRQTGRIQRSSPMSGRKSSVSRRDVLARESRRPQAWALEAASPAAEPSSGESAGGIHRRPRPRLDGRYRAIPACPGLRQGANGHPQLHARGAVRSRPAVRRQADRADPDELLRLRQLRTCST